jgi:hypothetical protein
VLSAQTSAPTDRESVPQVTWYRVPKEYTTAPNLTTTRKEMTLLTESATLRM